MELHQRNLHGRSLSCTVSSNNEYYNHEVNYNASVDLATVSASCDPKCLMRVWGSRRMTKEEEEG